MKSFTEKGGWYGLLVIALLFSLWFWLQATNEVGRLEVQVKNLAGLVEETRTERDQRETRVGEETRKLLKSFYAVEYMAHCRDVPDRGRQLELCRNGAHARAEQDAAKAWNNILKSSRR